MVFSYQDTKKLENAIYDTLIRNKSSEIRVICGFFNEIVIQIKDGVIYIYDDEGDRLLSADVRELTELIEFKEKENIKHIKHALTSFIDMIISNIVSLCVSCN